jgi:hypothetical protein
MAKAIGARADHGEQSCSRPTSGNFSLSLAALRERSA